MVNRFSRENDYRMVVGRRSSIPSILSMQKDWCTWKDCDDVPGLAAEDTALRRILEDRGAFPNWYGESSKSAEARQALPSENGSIPVI